MKQLLYWSELKSMNLPWISEIEENETVYTGIIRDIRQEGDHFSFSEDKNGLFFMEELGDNPLPEIGDRYFIIGSEYYKRGFATENILYSYLTKEEDDKKVKEYLDEIKKQAEEALKEEEASHNPNYTIINEENYLKIVEVSKSSDLDRATFLFAERWATLAESRITDDTSDEDFIKIMKETEREADVNGVTVAINRLSYVWKYGKRLFELRQSI